MIEADVAVVGGGPAGSTAALVLARARRRVILIDDSTYRNATADQLHGFPGRDGVDPAQLRRDSHAELERYGVRIVAAPVTSARRGSSLEFGFDSHESLRCRAALIATGVRDILPAIDGLPERWGRSVFNCPFCSGWEQRDSPVVVIDAAPGAGYLTTALRAWTSQIVVMAAPAIRRLIGDGTTLAAVEGRDGTVIEARAAFLRAPVQPRSGLARALGCALDDAGYIITGETGQSSQPDIWSAGDVRRSPPTPHQAVLAAADGSIAAIAIHRELSA